MYNLKYITSFAHQTVKSYIHTYIHAYNTHTHTVKNNPYQLCCYIHINACNTHTHTHTDKVKHNSYHTTHTSFAATYI